MALDRRSKVFYLPEERILGILRGELRVSNIPEGSLFERVHFNYERFAFGILVSHTSYDVVEEGMPCSEEIAEFERVPEPDSNQANIGKGPSRELQDAVGTTLDGAIGRNIQWL